MIPFLPFTLINLAIFRLSEKFPRTDRQTDKPSYRSSSPELKNSSLVESYELIEYVKSIFVLKCTFSKAVWHNRGCLTLCF